MRAGHRPTLEEVAREAGVSRATVSRVINGSPKVSDDVRAAVQAAVDALGYVPNRAARSLVTRRTDSIALVVRETETRFFSEPFFAGVVRGVGHALSAEGLQLVLAMARPGDDGERLERFLTAGHVDGVLLVSLHGRDPLLEMLVAEGIPTVVGGRPLDVEGVGSVDADNAGGARSAVEHLVARGRRTIATISGPLDMGVGLDRFAGYRDGLQAAGLEPDESLTVNGDFTQDGGAAAMVELLARRIDIDAVFAASDLMAAGALQVLAREGRRVPEDVSLVGFDDSPLAQLTDPPLTTIRQPLQEMGRAMAEMVVARIGAEGEVRREV